MPILEVLQDLIISFLNFKKNIFVRLNSFLLKIQMLKFGKNIAGK